MSSFYEFIGSMCSTAKSAGKTLNNPYKLNNTFDDVGKRSQDARGVAKKVAGAIKYHTKKGNHDTVNDIHKVTGY